MKWWKNECEGVCYFSKQFGIDAKKSENMVVSPPRTTNFLVKTPMLYRTLEDITTIFIPNDIPRKPVIFSKFITRPIEGYIVVNVLNPTKKAVKLTKGQKN